MGRFFGDRKPEKETSEICEEKESGSLKPEKMEISQKEEKLPSEETKKYVVDEVSGEKYEIRKDFLGREYIRYTEHEKMRANKIKKFSKAIDYDSLVKITPPEHLQMIKNEIKELHSMEEHTDLVHDYNEDIKKLAKSDKFFKNLALHELTEHRYHNQEREKYKFMFQSAFGAIVFGCMFYFFLTFSGDYERKQERIPIFYTFFSNNKRISKSKKTPFEKLVSSLENIKSYLEEDSKHNLRNLSIELSILSTLSKFPPLLEDYKNEVSSNKNSSPSKEPSDVQALPSLYITYLPLLSASLSSMLKNMEIYRLQLSPKDNWARIDDPEADKPKKERKRTRTTNNWFIFTVESLHEVLQGLEDMENGLKDIQKRGGGLQGFGKEEFEVLKQEKLKIHEKVLRVGEEMLRISFKGSSYYKSNQNGLGLSLWDHLLLVNLYLRIKQYSKGSPLSDDPFFKKETSLMLSNLHSLEGEIAKNKSLIPVDIARFLIDRIEGVQNKK